MNFFSYLFDPSYSITILIYNAIFFFTCAFAFLSESIRVNKKAFYLMSFFIAWFFYVFNDTGTDLSNYLQYYGESSFTPKYIMTYGLEPGYRFLTAFIHVFIKDAHWGISVVKTIQIVLVFLCIYSLKEEVHVGYSVMAYMALFYFPSFNVLRISLAGAVCLLSYVLVHRKKYGLSIIVALAGFSIHKAALVFIFTLAFYFCCLISKKAGSILRLLIILAVPIVSFLGRELVILFLNSGLFYERSSSYLSSGSSFGLMQIVYYLPLFIMLYEASRNKQLGTLLPKKPAFIWGLSGFVIAMMGYTVGILTRAAIFFIASFVHFCPAYIKKISLAETKTAHFFSPQLVKLLMLGYWIVRYMLDIGGYLITSGISEFKFFF